MYPRGKDVARDRITWDDVAKTQSGNQRVVSTNIDENIFILMEQFAPLLVAQGRIKNATPSAVAQFSINTTMTALKNLLESK